MAISRREFIRGGVSAFTIGFTAPAFLSDLARAQGASARNSPRAGASRRAFQSVHNILVRARPGANLFPFCTPCTYKSQPAREPPVACGRVTRSKTEVGFAHVRKLGWTAYEI